MNLAKPKRVTNRTYLHWVKTFPCILSCVGCVGPVDPHHVVPRSLGGSDYTAIPLCRRHHDVVHSNPNGYKETCTHAINVMMANWAEAKPLRRAPRQRADKIKPFKKRALLRGYAVRTKEGLNWPFRFAAEAQEERQVLGEGRVVRVQIREEGKR